MPISQTARRLDLTQHRGGSTKRVVPVDANTFWLLSRSVFGNKAIALKIVRGGANGQDTTSLPYDAWRAGPMQIVDTIAADPTLNGWKYLAQSQGARDYALNINSGSGGYFIGSYHGRETMISQTLMADGQVFDPVACAPSTFRRFEILRKTVLTGTGGELVYVDYYALVDDDNVWQETHTLDSTALSSNVSPNSCYATLDFVDPRFSMISVSGAAPVALSTANSGVNSLPDATRKVTFVDPTSGDQKDVEWTCSAALSGIYVLFNTVYSKLYVPIPASTVIGHFTVTRRDTFRIAFRPPPPALPYTDTFAGSALSANWTLLYNSGTAATSAVANNSWTLTSQGGVTRYTQPLNYPVGSYNVAMDYSTAAANTSASVTIQRSDSGSSSGAIAGPVACNAVSPGTTLNLPFTITEGMTPFLMVEIATPSGRAVTFTAMRITKVG